MLGGGGSEKHEKFEKLENAFGLSGYQRIAIVLWGRVNPGTSSGAPYSLFLFFVFLTFLVF
jgi:hypothetical protein